jgi:SAM-dependent methyltransferase
MTGPALPPRDSAPEVLAALRAVWDADAGLFHTLFVANRRVHESQVGVDSQVLAASRICCRQDGYWVSTLRVTRSYDLFVLSDTASYIGSDRVWYPLPDESLLFAAHIPPCAGERVLDVGCGSGILGLTAIARGAGTVTALDVSPRAIAFTEFNAAMNGCDGMCCVQTGLDAFAGEPHDRVLMNPPFVAVPDGTRYMLSGDGGRDGLAMVHQLFARLPDITHAASSVSIISLSPGDEDISALERLFLAAYRGRRMRIVVHDVYGSVCPIDDALEAFRQQPGFNAWTEWLRERRYTHMHYLTIDASPASRFSFERGLLHPPLEDRYESGTWGAMYRVIANSRDHAC